MVGMTLSMHCAQRLSASKIGSRNQCSPCGRAVECSTPVGIKDRFTPSLVRTDALSNVLNACRHQRSVHADCSCNSPILCDGAQRLSASKIGSRSATHFLSSLRWCSTPVGIKDRFTTCSQSSYDAKRGCSTPVGIKDRFTIYPSTEAPPSATCSTPVGIKDRFTHPLLSDLLGFLSAQRLSASKIGSRCQSGPRPW